MVSASILAACVVFAPAIGWAQARNGNVYNGTAHQPSAGVQSSERSAGVAPADGTIQQQNHDLDAINGQLQEKANRDANAVPSSRSNVFGVQPGGVVDASPSAGSSSGSGGAGGAVAR